MFVDHMMMKLGKRPRRDDPRTIKLARILTPALPIPPDQCDWTHGQTSWGMMLNDTLGDCIIADGPGHATQIWTLNAAGAMVTPSNTAILTAYKDWCGYNPATHQPTGAEFYYVLKDWKANGFNGQTLDAYAAVHQVINGQVSQLDQAMVRAAIWMFGGMYTGVQLPISAQNQNPWDVGDPNDPYTQPGTWGGHAILIVQYDADGLTCITWAGLQRMTWPWLLKYADEAYAMVNGLWLSRSGVTPTGLDMDTLEADVEALTA